MFQEKFDELDGEGLFMFPEDLNINVEHIRPPSVVCKGLQTCCSFCICQGTWQNVNQL